MYQLPNTTSPNTTPSSTQAPRSERFALASICAFAGAAILAATFYFYIQVADTSAYALWNWVQPGLFVASGALCVVAALVSLVHVSAGEHTFSFALGLLPLVLMWRLVLVGFRFAMNGIGWLTDNAARMLDGTIVMDWRPGWWTVVNIVVVLALVVGSMVAKARRDARSSGKDE